MALLIIWISGIFKKAASSVPPPALETCMSIEFTLISLSLICNKRSLGITIKVSNTSLKAWTPSSA